MAAFRSQSAFKGTIINVGFRSSARVLRFCLLIIISLRFGAGYETDAYFISQSILLLFYSLGDGVINLCFIPVFMDYKNRRTERSAWDLANATFTLLCLSLFVVSVGIFVFAPTLAKILAPGFSGKSLSMTTILIRIVSPAPMLAGMSFIPAAVFFSHRSFIVPAITGLFYGAGGIALALLLADRLGIYSIPLGSVMGVGVEALVLVWLIKRKTAMFGLSRDFKHSGAAQVRRLGGRRLLAFVFGRADIMVDRGFASGLGVGAVSCLSYAQRVFEIPLAILGTTLGRVFMPILSGYAASGAKDEIQRFLSKGFRSVGFVVIPLAVAFAVLRVPIIEVLFQRGAFRAADTHLTSTAFMFFDIGLLAVCFNTVLLSIFFALQDAATPLKIVLVSTPLNAVFDFVLIIWFGMAGIALGTSLLAMLKTAYLLRELRKKIGRLDGFNILASLLKVVLASGVMGLVCWAVLNSYGFLLFPDSAATRLFVLLVISAAIYLAACRILAVKELGLAVGLVRRKLFRKTEDE